MVDKKKEGNPNASMGKRDDVLFDALRGGDRARVRQAVGASQGLNHVDPKLATPLIFAVGTNSVEFACWLLTAGSNINLCDMEAGNTALAVASINKANPKMSLLLLDLGADPDIKNFEGVTARSMIMSDKEARHDVVQALVDIPVGERSALLAAGAVERAQRAQRAQGAQKSLGTFAGVVEAAQRIGTTASPSKQPRR